jgi:hypothetical protein
MKLYQLILSFGAISVVSACTTYNSPTDVAMQGDYWQRTSSSSALYLKGPKAQHQLNKDIASCVSEVRELSRLGSIRDATPPDNIAMTGSMKSYWDTPRRDGPLHTEYLEFHDFESCMTYHGWQRVAYVTPDRAKQSSYNYAETILGIPVPELWGQNNQHKQPKGDYDFNN